MADSSTTHPDRIDAGSCYEYTSRPRTVHAIMDATPLLRALRRRGLAYDPTVDRDLLLAVLTTCESTQADALIRAGIDPDVGSNEGLLDELARVQRMRDRHIDDLLPGCLASYKDIVVLKLTSPYIAHMSVTVYGYELAPF